MKLSGLLHYELRTGFASYVLDLSMPLAVPFVYKLPSEDLESVGENISDPMASSAAV